MKQLMKRVAIIDDGIYRCQETQVFVREFLEFDFEKKCFRPQYSHIERFSHGTCCAMILQKYCTEVEVVSLKILCQKNLYGSIEGLLAALNWCKNNDINIISLSLGTTSVCDFKPIQKIIDELIEDKILVVAAVCNEFCFTMPAVLAHVVGVASIKRSEYHEQELAFLGINVQANAVHEITIEKESYITPDCNSYATPYVVANLLLGLIDLGKGISYVNDIVCLTKYSYHYVKEGKIFIDFPGQKVKLTGVKKEFVALGIVGKNIEDVGFCEILLKKNVPIAMIKNRTSITKTYMSKISYLVGCDILLYETDKSERNADYVIIYNENYVAVKKKVLFFWKQLAIIEEEQLVDLLLEEIYGG